MDLKVWLRVHEGLGQQGPGSDASTLRALDAVGSLGVRPRIVDLGCGSGRATRALARATGGAVVGVDRMVSSLRRLQAGARSEGVGARVAAVLGDMRNPPVAEASVDLLWSEGAIYNLGFEDGLDAWRNLLRPEGACAVTECSWLAAPPDEVRAFWQDAYPGMGSVEENLAAARRAGFAEVTHFALPEPDWDAYYAPIRVRLQAWRPEYANQSDALLTLDEIQREIDIYDRREGSYSYVFYVLRLG